MERYFVDPKCDKITREDLYLVRLEKADGEAISSLEPKRLFPFTRPSEYITLIGEDRKEAAVIRSIDELDEESKRAVLECFKEIYLIPKISRVLLCSVRFGSLTFDVEIDRGDISFSIRNPHSDIKVFPDGRLIFRDRDDNRYEIPDVNKLDKASARQLFPYI